MTSWKPSRRLALEALEAFLPRAGAQYASRRNYDFGPGRHSHVSALSPYIRHRILTEQEVIARVLTQHSYTAAEKFVQEVCWRTYWKGWLELRPAVWRGYRREVDQAAALIREDKDRESLWRRAEAGQTGIECFDAWARELKETGYLHNHARMWFASIWIFTLGLPWSLGADFFLRHLLDGDPASNTLSWRWVGGRQTRGKTYLARPDNIRKYTDGRFDPPHELAGEAPAPAVPHHPEPGRLPEPDTPAADLKSVLLITEEDLSGDIRWLHPQQPAGIALVQATARRSTREVSARVVDFVHSAMDDAVRRLGLPDTPVADFRQSGQPARALAEWMRSVGAGQALTTYVPAGPTAEMVADFIAILEPDGLSVVQHMGDWDRLAWPHATAGFFRFRKKIPWLLREAGMLEPAAPA